MNWWVLFGLVVSVFVGWVGTYLVCEAFPISEKWVDQVLSDFYNSIKYLLGSKGAILYVLIAWSFWVGGIVTFVFGAFGVRLDYFISLDFLLDYPRFFIHFFKPLSDFLIYSVVGLVVLLIVLSVLYVWYGWYAKKEFGDSYKESFRYCLDSFKDFTLDDEYQGKNRLEYPVFLQKLNRLLFSNKAVFWAFVLIGLFFVFFLDSWTSSFVGWQTVNTETGEIVRTWQEPNAGRFVRESVNSISMLLTFFGVYFFSERKRLKNKVDVSGAVSKSAPAGSNSVMAIKNLPAVKEAVSKGGVIALAKRAERGGVRTIKSIVGGLLVYLFLLALSIFVIFGGFTASMLVQDSSQTVQDTFGLSVNLAFLGFVGWLWYKGFFFNRIFYPNIYKVNQLVNKEKQDVSFIIRKLSATEISEARRKILVDSVIENLNTEGLGVHSNIYTFPSARDLIMSFGDTLFITREAEKSEHYPMMLAYELEALRTGSSYVRLALLHMGRGYDGLEYLTASGRLETGNESNTSALLDIARSGLRGGDLIDRAIAMGIGGLIKGFEGSGKGITKDGMYDSIKEFFERWTFREDERVLADLVKNRDGYTQWLDSRNMLEYVAGTSVFSPLSEIRLEKIKDVLYELELEDIERSGEPEGEADSDTVSERDRSLDLDTAYPEDEAIEEAEPEAARDEEPSEAESPEITEPDIEIIIKPVEDVINGDLESTDVDETDGSVNGDNRNDPFNEIFGEEG